MARIPGIPAQQAGPHAKPAYYFTRRSLRQLTGRSPERVIEPLEITPGLLRAREAGPREPAVPFQGRLP